MGDVGGRLGKWGKVGRGGGRWWEVGNKGTYKAGRGESRVASGPRAGAHHVRAALVVEHHRALGGKRPQRHVKLLRTCRGVPRGVRGVCEGCAKGVRGVCEGCARGVRGVCEGCQ